MMIHLRFTKKYTGLVRMLYFLTFILHKNETGQGLQKYTSEKVPLTVTSLFPHQKSKKEDFQIEQVSLVLEVS